MGQGVFQQVVSVWRFLGSLDHHTNKTVIQSIYEENGTMPLRNMYSTKDIELWGETLRNFTKNGMTQHNRRCDNFLSGKTQAYTTLFSPLSQLLVHSKYLAQNSGPYNRLMIRGERSKQMEPCIFSFLQQNL
jgi:hypothetical protein